jgi:serine protease Do
LTRFLFRGRPTGAALTLAAALIVGGYGIAHADRMAPHNPPATFHFANPAESGSHDGFAPVVKRVLPEVVNISSSKVVKVPTGFSPGMDPFFQQFFGGNLRQGNQAPRSEKEQSLGSGVIVSPEGYILTNNHVVDGATDIRVTLSDKREFNARVVGTDPHTDIAVLKVDAGALPAITIGDSSKVDVGDYALAIGNPFGVGETVTMGIVSAKGRTNLGIEDYEDFIQTDAPINPGNSGGALINDHGELIGINTAIIAHGSDGNQGIGFAVPVNLAHEVMDQILKNGKVVRAYLGIVPQDVTPAIAGAFHVEASRGALVGDVSPNSPAQHAGIQKGDIILDVNGKPVTDANQLRMTISMMSPDTTVKLNVLRNGEQRPMSVQLAELPTRQDRASLDQGDQQNALAGVSVDNLTPDAARQLNLPPSTSGVVVTDVDPSSQAADSGLHPGDVIQEVNRKPVRNKAEFEAAVRNAGKNPLLLVDRGGNTLFVAV